MLEKGVSVSVIRTYENKYYDIIEKMKTVDSIEALEESKRILDEMINAIMKTVEGDVTEPEACKHEKTIVSTVEATCTESGYTKEICDACNEVISESYIAAFGHSFVDGQCTVCGEKEATEENKICYLFDDEIEGMKIRYEFYISGVLYVQLTNPETGEISKDSATWVLNGEYVDVIYEGKVVQQFTINDDGYTLTPVDSSTGDGCSHKSTITGGREATCTESGYMETICNECKEVLNREEIPALGHEYGEDGICTRCEESEGGSGEGSDAELSKLIEVAVNDAFSEWNQLLEKGVSASTIAT